VLEFPGEKTRKKVSARAAQTAPAVHMLVGQARSDQVRATGAAASKTNSS
jgi:hypothetical protein